MYPIGSTGQLADELYKRAGSYNYEPFLFYGIGNENGNPNIIKIETQIERGFHKLGSMVFGNQGYYSSQATKKVIRTLEEKGIHKVILMNLHGYYINEPMLLNYLREKEIQTVYVTCDEYAGLGKCPYSYDCENYKTGCGNCPRLREYPESFFFDRTKQIVQMKRRGYENPNIVFAGPRVNVEKFKESYLLKDKHLEELDWGIDLSLYNPKCNTDVLKQYGIPEDKILVLSVASFIDPRKGIKDFFFPATRLLDKSKYHFINVGFNGDEQELQDIPNKTIIPYLSDQSQLQELYAKADLFVVPSTYDTQPITALISFACGTPVCCFKTSGLQYIGPDDSETVLFADRISAEALAEAISKAKKKTEKLSKLCRDYAEERYSIEKFCHSVFNLWR